MHAKLAVTRHTEPGGKIYDAISIPRRGILLEKREKEKETSRQGTESQEAQGRARRKARRTMDASES